MNENQNIIPTAIPKKRRKKLIATGLAVALGCGLLIGGPAALTGWQASKANGTEQSQGGTQGAEWHLSGTPDIEAAVRANLGEKVGAGEALRDEHKAMVEALNLSDTPVTDLSPLTGLTNLTDLYLNRTSVSDLAPLAGLTNLTDLYLYSTRVTDLAPLAGLTNLTGLYLNKAKISDLSPLSGLTNLTDLHLNSTRVTDLSPLAGLTNLTDLQLWGIHRDLRLGPGKSHRRSRGPPGRLEPHPVGAPCPRTARSALAIGRSPFPGAGLLVGLGLSLMWRLVFGASALLRLVAFSHFGTPPSAVLRMDMYTKKKPETSRFFFAPLTTKHHTPKVASTMFTTIRTVVSAHALIIGIMLAILAGWLLAWQFTAPAAAVTQVIEAPAVAEFDPTAVFDD